MANERIDISGAGVKVAITIKELSPVPKIVDGIEQSGGIEVDYPENKENKLLLGQGTGMATGLKKVFVKFGATIVYGTDFYFFINDANNYEQTHGLSVTVNISVTSPSGIRDEYIGGTMKKPALAGIK